MPESLMFWEHLGPQHAGGDWFALDALLNEYQRHLRDAGAVQIISEAADLTKTRYVVRYTCIAPMPVEAWIAERDRLARANNQPTTADAAGEWLK